LPDKELLYRGFVQSDGWNEPGEDGVPTCPGCESELGFDGFFEETDLCCELIKQVKHKDIVESYFTEEDKEIIYCADSTEKQYQYYVDADLNLQEIK